MFLYSSMGLAACTSTEHRCINEQMFFLEAGPAIATLLFAGFVAFFLSWTKNKNFTLRFVQVVAFLFLAWSLASLTATLVRHRDANALGLLPAIRLGISRSVRPALI